MRHFRQFLSFILTALALLAMTVAGSFAEDKVITTETSTNYQLTYVEQEAYSITIPPFSTFNSALTSTVQVTGIGNLSDEHNLYVYILNPGTGFKLSKEGTTAGVACTITSDFQSIFTNTNISVGYLPGGLGDKKFETNLTFTFTPDANLPVGVYSNTITFVTSFSAQ